MTAVGLDHPLVREYLRALDAALALLRTEQDGALRKQIAARLGEAVTPAAGDAGVAAGLARLGSPADLAAEAAGDRRGARPGLRRRLARLSWRQLTALGAGLTACLAIAAYLIVIQTAPILVNSGAAGWWFLRDAVKEVDTSADGARQTTVPIRSGQLQGYAIDLVNTSDLTQTMLGPATGQGLPGDNIGEPAAPAQIGVNAPNVNLDNGGFARAGVRFVLPGVIPPHQGRLVRVLWTSRVCLEGRSAEGNDELALRVRIGWITRIEVIPLDTGWYLAGPSTGAYAVTGVNATTGKYCRG
jgi:hypothetical protein